MKSHILAIDQGTTGSTVLVLSADGQTLSRVNREFPQHFPEPGHVEHDPDEIWASVEQATREAIQVAKITAKDIAAIGITNQRETTLMWDRSTGKPIHRAIVWQDRRTAGDCRRLREAGVEPRVREVTGLVLDPYFSATKARWLLDAVPSARARAARGELCLGTVDSYLVWRLTGGGANAAFVTDTTNASRTLLMDLQTGSWSSEMCELFEIPEAVLPRILPSAGSFGATVGFTDLPDGTPITGIAGDQHAALFGQGCFGVGDIKCTYGTGAFVLVNTGERRCASQAGLLSTVGWKIGERTTYALEGSCFVAGAAVQWLRDGLGIIESATDIEALASQVESSAGVAFVPALAGLGAPYWDPEARGLISGITRGTTRAHLARATLEAIAFQVDDLIRAMRQDLGTEIARLRVDGGAAANNLLLQLQADISSVSVDRPTDLETTARGAAMLAGIGAGIFSGLDQAARMIQIERQFDVKVEESHRAQARARWDQAVRRTRMS